ncbi:MAG: hypothetical protein QOE66_1237 [Chloroflexota bacterium]|jgi:hypothetical protein|nr:hypothetical protein [Chloroflexota bacterium]
MANDRSHARPRTIAVLIGLGAVVAAVGEGRADRIMLRGGGQIRGKVLSDPQHPDRRTILTETGKTPLNFQKAQILEVHAEPSALDEYLERRDQAAPTAASQYELGLWCDQHKLKDLARVHYEEALKLDKTFTPAHQKLGHVLYSETWLWGDELREAQGLVRYKGQWISKQEKERREELEATNAEQASWVRRLKLMRQAILSGSEDRRRDAETQLREIRDPVAVPPLVQILGQASEPLRALLDRVLAEIPGPEAASALVRHILYETDPDVRHVTIDVLLNRKDPEIVPGLVKALQSREPTIVNRAAWSLGQLNAVTTVPKLIPALITTQYRIEMPPIGGGSSGGGISASFGSVAPSPGMGSGYVSGGGSYGLLTPPVVGPGVAAFGGSAVPMPWLPSNSFSTGGGVSGTRSGPPPRIVPITYQNVEVLAALVKLSGADFGYDILAWRRWVSSSFHPDPTPARRVPQP